MHLDLFCIVIIALLCYNSWTLSRQVERISRLLSKIDSRIESAVDKTTR